MNRQLRRVRQFLGSATARLAATYLAIIMVMSLCFSIAIYNVSSHELGRKAPPNSYFRNLDTNGDSNSGSDDTTNDDSPNNGGMGQGTAGNTPPPTVEQFLENRAAEARQALVQRLVILNVLVLLGGIAVSYYLSRRTLQPIEDAMEAQVQFVSDASHELRTPLTAIQTSNEVALRAPKLTLPAARKLIEQNTEDVRRLKALSDGLLDLAKHGRSDMLLAPVQLQDAASQAMTLVVGQAAAKNIAVEDKLPAGSVLADRACLVQLLVILLDNAVKYSPAGSTVHLEARSKGKNVYLDVRDEGIGIRASDIPHLFRRFYRADNARTSAPGQAGGYGLGLAIAKQIATNMHGDILVESTPGKGSTFSLRLPNTK